MKKKTVLSPAQVILFGFIGVILVGAMLLMLPISSRTGDVTSPLTAFFTATSATCVTGLIVVDTFTHWSGFGQVIILLLIQIGGLGIMTIASLLSFFLRRNISFKERMLMSQSLSLLDMAGVVRITKHAIIATLTIEAAGALILSARFIKDFGILGGIAKGIFHSVSAFCNAGFDLMGQIEPFIGITPYVSDITVTVTIGLLIIIGGLGFFVWEDIYRMLTKKTKLTLYTKLVLVMTGALVVVGAILIFIFEHNNPATLGGLDTKGQVLGSFFQSVTPRTAGYNTISQAGMTSDSKFITVLLMFIGGSSGSTAGGIKTVTFGLLIIAIWQVSKGRRQIVIRGKSISNENILRATAIAGIALFLTVSAAMIISIAEGGAVSFSEAIFETFSAFGTVGLTLGITPELSVISKLVLATLMIMGRVGILTVTYSIVLKFDKTQNKINYPEGKVLIG
ncbi:MAG: TrkH family potassium uptake protein [Clostridia bacterium]